VGREAVNATTIAAILMRFEAIAGGTTEKFAANIGGFFGKNGRFRPRPERSKPCRAPPTEGTGTAFDMGF